MKESGPRRADNDGRHAPDESPDISAQALSEWQAVTDQVLVGVAHSLNNRAVSIAAVLELLPDSDGTDSIATILGSEQGSLLDLVTVVNALGRNPRGSDATAFLPAEAAREAERVLALHALRRGNPVKFNCADAAPVRLPRWMFVRALIALGAAAQPGQSDAPPVILRIVDEGDWVECSFTNGGSTVAAKPSRCATELASAMGGESLDERSGRIGFRVPSLAAIRRREAR